MAIMVTGINERSIWNIFPAIDFEWGVTKKNQFTIVVKKLFPNTKKSRLFFDQISIFWIVKNGSLGHLLSTVFHMSHGKRIRSNGGH